MTNPFRDSNVPKWMAPVLWLLAATVIGWFWICLLVIVSMVQA